MVRQGDLSAWRAAALLSQEERDAIDVIAATKGFTVDIPSRSYRLINSVFQVIVPESDDG